MNIGYKCIVFFLTVWITSIDLLAAQQNEHSQYTYRSAEILSGMLSVQTESAETHSFTFSGTPLNEALRQIANRGRLKILANSKLIPQTHKVTGEYQNISLAEAFHRVLEETSLDFLYSGNGYIIIIPKIQTEKAEQQETVRGTVVDAETGEALPGVNIVVEGTNIGTTTDTDGAFEFEIPGLQENLVFTFVGYERLTVGLDGRSEINVELRSDVQMLDDLVVVGYGQQRKSTITGSISSINFEETATLATQRTDQMLQGRASGLMVLNTDAAPGGNTEIRIRGMNSILGGNEALIVVDGLQGRNLTSINPNDIESIEVLKDASATAIYGSEGANGVILIETKQGRSGTPRLQYTSEISTANLAKKIDLMNAADYARYINEIELANNVGRVPEPVFSESEIREFEADGGTDWQDVIYRRAMTQNHQLSVNGGTDDIRYYVSGAYLDQEGILLNSGYERMTVRARVDADFTEWASVGLNWAGSREIDHSPLFGGQTDWANNPVGGAMHYPPTLPPKNDDGSYSVIPNNYGPSVLWNPLASAAEPFIDNNEIKNEINGFVRFRLLNELSLEVNGGASLERNNNLQYWNLNTFNGRQQGGQGLSYNGNSNYYQFQNILTYQTSIGRHNITATGVTELKYNEFYSNEIINSEFVNHDTGVYDFGGAEIQNTTSTESERKIQSALGRLNYEFDSRYLLTASFRVDGSSVFGANNKWSRFPAVSVGWRVSEEPFLENTGVLSNLMLRASWGKSGNQAIHPYQTLAAISQTGNYPWNGGSSVSRGFNITRAANPQLKWEVTTQTNVGIDLELFEGRLNIATEYYNKITDNLLLERELPRTSGLTSIIDNVGSMENQGFEISIDGRGRIGTVSVSSGVNFTRSRTKVLDLGEDEELAFRAGGSGAGTVVPFMYLREGEKFGQMIGWGYEGTWNTDEAEEAAVYGQLPGDPRYTDLNNDGVIDNDDQMVIGNSMPDFIFGFNNSLRYKNVELYFLIQGTVGNDIFNIAKIRRIQDGTSTRLLDRWTPENQDTDIPAIIDGQTREEAGLTSTINFPAGAQNQNSRWVEDGSYLRLKNISLAYSFPGSITEKLWLSGLRIYASATNLLTFTRYTGFDPEVSSFTDNDAQLGTDFNNYPSARMFSFGLNISF